MSQKRLQNRLKILMAERELTITRVAKDVGISRNTITAIAQNDSEMIRIATLQTLLDYLRVTPNDFFNYKGMHEPLDLKEKWKDD